jgi:hypothetical protein
MKVPPEKVMLLSLVGKDMKMRGIYSPISKKSFKMPSERLRKKTMVVSIKMISVSC